MKTSEPGKTNSLKTFRILKETYKDTDFGGRYIYEIILEGLVHHDVYHLGQIGLTIKFSKKPQGL